MYIVYMYIIRRCTYGTIRCHLRKPKKIDSLSHVTYNLFLKYLFSIYNLFNNEYRNENNKLHAYNVPVKVY